MEKGCSPLILNGILVSSPYLSATPVVLHPGLNDQSQHVQNKLNSEKQRNPQKCDTVENGVTQAC